jgi:hypothetical protein
MDVTAAGTTKVEIAHEVEKVCLKVRTLVGAVALEDALGPTVLVAEFVAEVVGVAEADTVADGDVVGVGAAVDADADMVAELANAAQAVLAPALGVNDATENSKGTEREATLLGSAVVAIALPLSSNRDTIAPLAR